MLPIWKYNISWTQLGLFLLGCGVILMFTFASYKEFSIKLTNSGEYPPMKNARFKEEIRLEDIKTDSTQNVAKKHCTSAFEASSSGQWQIRKNKSQPIWLPNRCIFKTPNQAEIIKIANYNNLSRIVFLGDSKTYHLSIAISKALQCSGPVIQQMRGRCDMDIYLGTKVNVSNWRQPRNQQEGPCEFGLSHSGCTDCSGCQAFWRKCSGNITASTLSVEYIPMEFARDVEVQSTKYATTQEHIVEHLQRTGRPDIIIFNAGLHDLAYANLTAFYDNLAWLTKKMLSAFSACKLLFINNSGILDRKVPERFRNITGNIAMYKYNNAANEIMTKLNVPFLDQWTMSDNDFAINNLHDPGAHDCVHMTGPFDSQSVEFIFLEIQKWYQN